MNWRQWIGLPPTEADFASHLLSIAKQAGELNWRYDVANSSLRSGEQVVNLGNLYLEYARAPRNARAGFRDKYRAILAPPKAAGVAALWSVAQTHLYPLLRSRCERVALDIQHRGKEPMPPRAAKPLNRSTSFCSPSGSTPIRPASVRRSSARSNSCGQSAPAW